MSTHVCIYMYIASVVVTHRLSSCRSRALEHRLSSCGARAYCPEACRIVPDQELNLCLLLWQVDSLPLSHQGSPTQLSWRSISLIISGTLFESIIVLNSTTFSCSVVGFLSLGKSSCTEGVDFKHKERLKEAETIPPTLDSNLCLPTSTWYNLFLQDPVLLRSTRG